MIILILPGLNVWCSDLLCEAHIQDIQPVSMPVPALACPHLLNLLHELHDGSQQIVLFPRFHCPSGGSLQAQSCTQALAIIRE